MHRFNKLYGYGDILRTYCGVEAEKPIWGEVQHSLFMNTYHFTGDGHLGPLRDQMGKFPRLLSWQTILPFPHQLPIGIPLAYFLDMNKEQFPLPDGYGHLADKDFVLVMPRMDKDIKLDKRVERYQALVEEGLSKQPGRYLVFALHPKDAANKDTLEKEFGKHGEFVWRGKTDATTDLKWSFALVQNASEMWSNYFGAHVFQAAAFFKAPTRLFGDNLFRSVYHDNLTPYLEDFYNTADNIDAQANVASKVLGLEHVRTVDELRDVLGFTGGKSLLGKPVRFAYRRLRRIKVHWRVARGHQSPRGQQIGQ